MFSHLKVGLLARLLGSLVCAVLVLPLTSGLTHPLAVRAACAVSSGGQCVVPPKVAAWTGTGYNAVDVVEPLGVLGFRASGGAAFSGTQTVNGIYEGHQASPACPETTSSSCADQNDEVCVPYVTKPQGTYDDQGDLWAYITGSVDCNFNPSYLYVALCFNYMDDSGTGRQCSSSSGGYTLYHYVGSPGCYNEGPYDHYGSISISYQTSDGKYHGSSLDGDHNTGSYYDYNC